MKKLFCFTLMLFSAFSCCHVMAAADEQSLDQMVAVVNDDVITKSELTQAIVTIKSQIANQNVTTPSDKVLQKQVLEQLINKKIQLQVAKQAGVAVNDEELDRTIKQIASQHNITVDNLYKRIQQEGMSTQQYRAEMHDQILLHKLQQQEVAGKISISPQEVTTFMNSQVWQSNSSKEYRIEDILIPVADAPTPDDLSTAKKRAQDVLAKVKAGQDFSSIAQAESKQKNALQGGDLGWRKLPEIPSAFTEEVSHMRKDEVAGPIQTPNGFHIIKLADSRAAAANKQALNRKAVENLLLQQKFEEAVQNWVSKLRSQAFVEVHPQKQWS